MYEHVNNRNGEPSPLVADELYQIVMEVNHDSCAFAKPLQIHATYMGISCRMLRC